jgi:hypothetical protein
MKVMCVLLIAKINNFECYWTYSQSITQADNIGDRFKFKDSVRFHPIINVTINCHAHQAHDQNRYHITSCQRKRCN